MKTTTELNKIRDEYNKMDAAELNRRLTSDKVLKCISADAGISRVQAASILYAEEIKRQDRERAAFDAANDGDRFE